MCVLLDLQVTVDSDGQNVTLTCKTSCPPTASKHSFIWWKNEGSAWICLDPHHSCDELHVSAVSREDSGRYSCALESFPTFRSAETLLGVDRESTWETLDQCVIVWMWNWSIIYSSRCGGNHNAVVSPDSHCSAADLCSSVEDVSLWSGAALYLVDAFIQSLMSSCSCSLSF